MASRLPFLQRVGRGVAVAVFATASMSVFAAEALFPRPLHIVRKIEDPLAERPTVVHEYCAGNRIVTVRADRVAIADYDSQQIIEIDRAAATYSITRFDEVARSQPRGLGASSIREPLKLVGADTYEAGFDNAVRLEVMVDRRFDFSRGAIEALIGAAFPSHKTAEHDVMLQAARSPRERIASQSVTEVSYALPVSQTLSFNTEGSTLVLRNTVVSVTPELVPPELLTIPPGAKQIESARVRVSRELNESDRQ